MFEVNARFREELRRCVLEGADRTRFLEAARERASQYVPDAGTRAEALVEGGVFSTVDEVIRTLLALQMVQKEKRRQMVCMESRN
ncbi:MAG: hypothetical protein ACLT76_01940 [Clostridium fessum]